MFIKALILDRNQGLLHILGNIFILHPDAALVAADRDGFLPLPGKILVPDGAGFAELIVFQRQIEFRGQAGFYIIGKNAGEDQTGQSEDQQDRAEEFENGAERDGNGVDLRGNLRSFRVGDLAGEAALEGGTVGKRQVQCGIVSYIQTLQEYPSYAFAAF